MTIPRITGLVLLLATWATDAHAQSASARIWSDHVIVPQARAYAMNRSPAMQITGVTVGVVVRDQLATTIMEIRLRNPGGRREEAELLLPVPDGAVVKGFAFQGQAAEPTARLLPAEEARQTYERIVAQARDPALLEFAGFRMVRSSVFPVEPGGTQAVRLTYEHLLPATGERVDYVLPRSESVEYNVPWKVAVKISAETPIDAVYSPSHMVNTRRPDPRTALVELAESAAGDPGPFRLSFLREKGEIAASLFAYPDPRIGGGYFLLLAGLPAPSAKSARTTLQREVTLVIDHSGSMRGEKIDQVREAALQVIAGLDEGEAFNVILYNEGVESLAERPLRKSRSTEAKAREFLEGMTARGGTNIHDALLEALRQPLAPETLPIVLFMTDGLPTVGQTAEASIRDLARQGNTHQRRIFTFGVGVDVNTPLLEKLAYESRATATFILPREDVELKVAGVFQRLRGPLLADPVLSIGEESERRRVREVIPARLPDVFEGDQLVVLGQYVGEQPLEFRLKGNYRGARREFAFRLPLDRASTRNGFVPRLWAGRKIGLLVDAIREQGGSANPTGAPPTTASRELVDEIVRLSTEFGILTEYTAFLAKDGSVFKEQEEIRRQTTSNFNYRAIETRSGLASVNQDVNNQLQKSMNCVNPRNWFLDSSMNAVSTTSVQQVADLAFYKQGDCWVDSRLVSTRKEASPKKVVEFGSPEFRALLTRLADEGRQGGVALRGDVLMLIDGDPVLIKAPTAAP